mmetsp:Transcript_13548/g.19906  ORF Transcript_13548/g.19906 Transcript_13548/m.19906 type:complete len:108 (+) Transcript_13548:78-401(+)
MEGRILAEFSNLNSLNLKPIGSSFSTPRERPPQGATPRDDVPYTERLLRGELTYTGSAEYFIEDQPQVQHLGVQHLLPDGAGTQQERERLIRRLEMCAKRLELPFIL